MKDYLEDSSLSWKARGIMSYLVQYPHTPVSQRALAELSPDGVTAVRAALAELEQGGYIVRTRSRRPDGKFQWQCSIKPCAEFPCAENLIMDEPIIVVDDLSNGEYITTTTMSHPPMDKPSTENLSMVEGRKLVIRAYENEIGVITHHIAQQIDAAVSGYGVSLVGEAIELAAQNNVRKWSYVNGILERWRASGRQSRHTAPQQKRPKTISILDDDGNPLKEVMVNV